MNPTEWHWLTHTEPFSSIGDPTQPAHFVVEQVGDALFAIPEECGFQYNPPDGRAPIRVDHTSLLETDFASIPSFMSWFVSRYGRHTAAALVHDQLIVDGMPFGDRRSADREFLSMMDGLRVPPVRSRVMWAAVSLATRWDGGTARRIGMIAWFVTAAGGLTLLIHGIATRSWTEVLGALLLQIPASVLWGSLWVAGVIAGYALPLVATPAVASFVGYGLYVGAELGVKLIRKLIPRNRDVPLEPPIKFREM
jgi:hypothetical protein